MATPWHNRYALRTEGMGSSVIRELLKLTEQPDVISFAGGLPAPEMFPLLSAETLIVPPVRRVARICRLEGRTGEAGTRKVASSTGVPSSVVSSERSVTVFEATGTQAVRLASPVE